MSLLIDDSAWSAQNYTDSFFLKKPTDLRYLKTEYYTYYAQTESTDQPFSITLPKRSGPEVYHLNKLLMEVQLKLVDSDGNIPANGSNVAPVNNILHSIFMQVKLKLNQYELNKQANHYPLKAYLYNTLNFSGQVKQSLLANEGYYRDTPDSFEIMDTNDGFLNRRALFVKTEAGEDGTPRVYDSKGLVLTGKIGKINN